MNIPRTYERCSQLVCLSLPMAYLPRWAITSFPLLCALGDSKLRCTFDRATWLTLVWRCSSFCILLGVPGSAVALVIAQAYLHFVFNLHLLSLPQLHLGTKDLLDQRRNVGTFRYGLLWRYSFRFRFEHYLYASHLQ